MAIGPKPYDVLFDKLRKAGKHLELREVGKFGLKGKTMLKLALEAVEDVLDHKNKSKKRKVLLSMNVHGKEHLNDTAQRMLDTLREKGVLT